jgi:hypothetical protein
MSWVTANYGYWEFWAPYDPINGYYGGQKCTFDGLNKIIYVNPDVTELSIRDDVYSNWKEWVQVRDNSKFAPAIRTTGGDPVGSGQFTGDVYFLINGWKLYVDLTKVSITGVLYSDNYNTAYYSLIGVPQFPVKVSSLVSVVATETIGGISIPSVQEIRQEMDTNSSKLIEIKSKTDTITTAPTAAQIADEVRIELTPELAKIMTLSSNPGLTNSQATMLLEMYELLGLDPAKPLIVTETSRVAGDIEQNIITSSSSTIVTRV